MTGSAKQSMVPHGQVDCFVASLPAMTWKHTSSFPRHDVPEFCNLVVPLLVRGRRESRAPAAPVASCAKESTRVRNYRFSQDIPAFPAQWCYGLFRALPGERPLLPPSLHGTYQQFSARVAAPGPHDFAVRRERFVQRRRPTPDAMASIASRAQRAVTIAIRPLVRHGMDGIYFCFTELSIGVTFFRTGVARLLPAEQADHEPPADDEEVAAEGEFQLAF
jgi:hypothetical protein